MLSNDKRHPQRKRDREDMLNWIKWKSKRTSHLHNMPTIRILALASHPHAMPCPYLAFNEPFNELTDGVAHRSIVGRQRDRRTNTNVIWNPVSDNNYVHISKTTINWLENTSVAAAKILNVNSNNNNTCNKRITYTNGHNWPHSRNIWVISATSSQLPAATDGESQSNIYTKKPGN